MKDSVPITVAYGDGIGPEIMEAVLYILKEAEARIRLEVIEVGEKLYKKHYTSGIAEDTWQSLERTKILLKAPITTPQGGGYKSLNVTLRKALSLYANVRPSISYHPFVSTLHPDLDIVIVRENEEDLYSGIEYRPTHDMYESVKIISRSGSEKIIRFAFEFAIKNKRRKVSCFSKDNIMKFTDGIFHKVFDEIAAEYPEIKAEHYIVDIGTARLATKPSAFDVIVTSNLYGDIISDVTAEISGSVGLAGSANIGSNYALFEAIHGSAPDIAGQDVANPSGLLNAAIMMLVHIQQGDIAALIENAWKKTLEDGIHTSDIYNDKTSSKKVGTQEFTKEVVKRLGQTPNKLKLAAYSVRPNYSTADLYTIKNKESKNLVGVDVFMQIETRSAQEVATKIQALELKNLELKTISCKGLKLWPSHNNMVELLSDYWCGRFMPKNQEDKMERKFIAELIEILIEAKIDFVKIVNLYEFDGKSGFSLSQGE